MVKIDTVGLDDSNATRNSYMALRGPYDASAPFVAKLPAADGLERTLEQLIAWSVEAIRDFKLRYDEVVAKLNLGQKLSDEDLLKHFDGKPAFQTFRASWSPQDKALFCRLARAVHSAGLDWWHMSKGIQVRFGRKNPGSERAVGVLGMIRGTRTRELSWSRQVGAVPELDREPLTQELVAQIETALSTGRGSLDEWLTLDIERPGLWPDQLRDDPVDPGEESDEGETGDAEIARQPINRIYYGPPGTGKTYELSKLLKWEYEQATDSVSNEEWRNQFIAAKIASVRWWEGVVLALYDLGEKASVSQLLEHPFIDAIADAKGRQDNLFAWRGKLLMAPHLRQNLYRADRFFTEHDEFSIDRSENRLLHAALQRVLLLSASLANQQLARKLQFVLCGRPDVFAAPDRFPASTPGPGNGCLRRCVGVGPHHPRRGVTLDRDRRLPRAVVAVSNGGAFRGIRRQASGETTRAAAEPEDAGAQSSPGSPSGAELVSVEAGSADPGHRPGRAGSGCQVEATGWAEGEWHTERRPLAE